MTGLSKFLKRTFDVTFSAAVLVVASPVMLAIWLTVKRGSEGSAIYRQERIGWRERPFVMYKFRTMIADAEKDGPQLSSPDDTRITREGRFLRKYHLDELPQFWNVLRGDMSVVGPRPERRYFVEKIIKELPGYSQLCSVRPGITSWGMVNYGYASSVEQMAERARLDMQYISGMSAAFDMKIMLRTLVAVAKGKGV